MPADPTDDAQAGLFELDVPAAAGPVHAAVPGDDVRQLAAALRERFGDRIRLGTSSWSFPGWTGLVWGREYSEQSLSRHGLAAYSRHPLLGTVSLDRSFYRPLEVAAYARMADQVPAAFRFVVKAAAAVTDATVRDPGAGGRPNPQFLDPAAAVALCAIPATRGLGDKLGALVFQLSPVSPRWLERQAELLERLDRCLDAVVQVLPDPTIVAVELRDAELVTPGLAALLKTRGARYALGLHDRMPVVDAQLPMLRSLWPGPLVCRWNLQRGLVYQQAKNRFEPFDRLAAPDPATRRVLARVMRATAEAGHPVLVTINNKAEGSAPWSVIELVRELLAPPDPA